jgi:hypothetical protein
MFTFNTARPGLVLIERLIMLVLFTIPFYGAHSQTCDSTSGFFSILYGMPYFGYGTPQGAEPVQDCSAPQVPYVSLTLRGIIPDNLYSNYCNGHSGLDSLDIWLSRTGTADPDPCKSCPSKRNLWYWDSNQSKWVNNSMYIDANGDGSFTMSLSAVTGLCQTSTCVWNFVGKRDGSYYCGQLSNDCFNRGSVTWTRTGQ